MRIKSAVVMAAGGLLLAAGSALAHHAFAAEFDVNKPIKLQGTLTKWEMVNPHSWFHIDVKGPDGKVSEWLVEGGSPNQLIRMGVDHFLDRRRSRDVEFELVRAHGLAQRQSKYQHFHHNELCLL